MIPNVYLSEGTVVVEGCGLLLTAADATRLAGRLGVAAAELEAVERRAAEQARIAALPPVDRNQIQLSSGEPIPLDRSHVDLKEDGQQKGYVVLTPAERAKGFVRPVRTTYKHLKCGTTTTMGIAIAETYARDPQFYNGTFCCNCGAHFPISTYGQEGEFVWLDGSKVGE